MPVKEIVSEHSDNMDKTISYFEQELRGIRTGRASTGLVENLKVDYYGSPTPLKQLANLAVPQPNSIVIKPFDPGSTAQIEKAIKNSELSIAPLVEGNMIRLNIPDLSEERRQQLITQVKNLAEEAKIGIRNIRRDANKHLENEEKDKAITEDDLELGKKQIDDITKKHTAKIDELVKHKSQEILQN
jgi:ribosome recycling factor